MGNKSSHHTIHYVAPPQLVQAVEDAERRSREEAERLERLRKESEAKAAQQAAKFERQQAQIRQEQAEAQRKAAQLREQAEKPKREYNAIVQRANDIVSRASQKVALVLGAQGAGKSTICKHMLDVKECETGVGNNHVTTKLTVSHSPKIHLPVVDSIGKIPDVGGIIRVMACAFNYGWDPAALIVVHSGRNGHFNDAAKLLQASKVNTINFEPKTFYRMKDVGSGLNLEQCLNMTVFNDGETLPYINSMDASSVSIEESLVSKNLLCALSSLTWDRAQQASEEQGILMEISHQLAKCIVERADFVGNDIDFIDQQ